MAISENKMQIVIDNYFKSECDINTSIRSAFEKGFRIGVKKASSAHPDLTVEEWRQLKQLIAAAQPEIIRCKDCNHWRRQTHYAGVPLSFGFCESNDMWSSLYGDTYEVSHIDTNGDFYCGYAERREDG